jgi:hypothetical protein
MTREHSLRSALLRPGSWQRFAVAFPLCLLVGFRRDLLSAMGYADVGTPRWTYAAVMAGAFMVFILLSVRDPIWRPLADRSSVVRFGFSALPLLSAGTLLLVAFAGRPFTNPIFWAAGAVMLLTGLLELLLKRTRKPALSRDEGVTVDEPDLIGAK